MKEQGSASVDGVDDSAEVLLVDNDCFLKIKCISFGTELVRRSEHSESVSSDSYIEFILMSMMNSSRIGSRRFYFRRLDGFRNVACLVIL